MNITKIHVSQNRCRDRGRLTWFTDENGDTQPGECVFSVQEVDQLARENGLDPNDPDEVEWEEGTEFPGTR